MKTKQRQRVANVAIYDIQSGIEESNKHHVAVIQLSTGPQHFYTIVTSELVKTLT